MVKYLYLLLFSRNSSLSLDLKCIGQPRCWYCENRCEHCLQDLQMHHQVLSNDGVPLKYCGEHFTPNPTEILVIFHPMKYSSHAQIMNVPPGHCEVLRYTELNLESYYCQVYVSLCIGDGSQEFPSDRFYIMLNIRHAGGQCYLQFFISENFKPLENINFYSGITTAYPEEEVEWKSIACYSLKRLYSQYFISAFKNFLLPQS